MFNTPLITSSNESHISSKLVYRRYAVNSLIHQATSPRDNVFQDEIPCYSTTLNHHKENLDGRCYDPMISWMVGNRQYQKITPLRLANLLDYIPYQK